MHAIDEAFKPSISRVLLAVTVLLLRLAAPSAVGGLEREIVVGGTAGWDDVHLARNVTFRPGRRDLDVAVLRDTAYLPRATTDLLLQFDDASAEDAAGNYRVLESDIDFTARNAQRGAYAARFLASETGVALRGGPLAAFRPGRVWDSFAVEFWIYPARVHDGEQILRWRGGREVGGDLLDQRVSVDIHRGHMRWRFENIFILPDFEPYDIELSSAREIVPNRWSHHRLEFDAENGMLEYLIDGEPVAIAYATDSGEPGDSVRLPHLGGDGAGVLRIGAGYSGLLDELRIQEFEPAESVLEEYPEGAGQVTTRSFDLERSGATLRSIDLATLEPDHTETKLFMRTGDAIDAFGAPDGVWEPVGMNDRSEHVRLGRFVQFRIELYSDGRRSATPEVERLAMRYIPNRAPGPPGRLRVTEGDGRLSLSWRRAPGVDVKGYRVYYGARPGEYFGDAAVEGASPIDVGDTTSFELSGLENGQTYYVTVVAYDEVMDDEGIAAEEVRGRPRRR